MKKLYLTLTVIVLLLLSTYAAQAQSKKSSIEGAWQLVNVRSMVGDKIMSEFPVNYTGSQIKIWTKTHWTFVSRYKQDSTFSDEFGGGTYKLDGNKYEENVVYHFYKPYIGKILKMLLEIKNDTLTQTFPLDKNGQIFKLDYSIEKYIRLE
jgi:opacity protein-like surface antigen